jgi:hypothetical protein
MDRAATRPQAESQMTLSTKTIERALRGRPT